MLSYENQEKILSALTDPATTQWNNGTTADAILISAGGDDIVGDQFAIFLTTWLGAGYGALPGDPGSIQAAYMDLFALRDIASQGN